MKEALFVGESNPYGADPSFALYPLPVRSAGGRLCSLILGLRRVEYLRRFERVNLCAGKWRIAEARERAKALCVEFSGLPLILLGSKVSGAFGLKFEPFTTRHYNGDPVVILPHPSGLCRLWALPGAIADARRAVSQAGIVLDRKEADATSG